MASTRKSRRPIMRVLDALGKRWALRVLWELRDGPRTFRGLREACDDISPSSLNQRLGELRELGVVEPGNDGYALTPPGVRLSRILLELYRWSEDALGAPLPPGARQAASPSSQTRRGDKRNAGASSGRLRVDKDNVAQPPRRRGRRHPQPPGVGCRTTGRRGGARRQ